MKLTVKVDDREVRQLLARFTEAETKKLLRKGMTKAGAAMKPVVRPAIPVGATGNLRGALKAKRIKASLGIGVVVGPMGRKASHRHFVSAGTKPRYTRSGASRGSMPANPWLDSVDTTAFNKGLDAVEAVIDEALA